MAKLIVTGASGQLGQLVIGHLLNTYKVEPSRIIAVTRNTEQLKDLTQKGLDVRKGDFNEPDSLAGAFKGAERILIITTNTPSPNGRQEQLLNALKKAVEAGVKHVVLTSFMTPPAGLRTVFPETGEVENCLKTTAGITYTIVGYDFWSESLFQLYDGALHNGTLYTTSANGKASHVTREDYSRAAAAALAIDKSVNVKFEVSGPELLTRKQVVDAYNEVFGLSIKIVEVPESELAEKNNEHTKSMDAANLWKLFDLCFRDGQYSIKGDGYQKLTGQQPESFIDFLRRTKDQYAPKK